VPEGLEALVGKCMAKDCAQGYANAHDLLDDLRLVQAGVTPTRLPKVLPPPADRKRRRGMVGAVLALAVLAAGFILYQRAHSTPILHERGWVLISDFESRGDDPIPDAGVGALEPARRVLHRLQEASQKAPTKWNRRSALALQGEIAREARKPKQAVSSFFAAEDVYPQAASHVFLADAYEAQHDWQYAAQQQQVLNARGEILQEEFPADLALAHLHLARIICTAGERPVAVQQYEEFLRVWREGDDVRQKREAESELQKLIHASEQGARPG
jgi:hypothetical protein